MRCLYFYLTILLILSSCSSRIDNQYSQIQGDWISNRIESEEGRRLIFSFEDTLCTYLYAWGDYTSFRIEDGKLFVKESDFRSRDNKEIKQTYVFRIADLNENKMLLIPDTKETKQLFENYDNFKIDTITLIKVKRKNDILPSRISFFSTRCYGTCPSILFEIDSSRNVLFYGYAYAEKEGGYKGKISNKEYLTILDKIWNLPLDSVKEDYDAGWTDDQTCGITIDYQNKSLQSVVYGFDQEPIELRILFHKLFETYKDINLIKDSIDLSDFINKRMFYKMVPLPPPPLTGPKYTSPFVVDTID